MSLIPIAEENIETYELTAHPSRLYTSASANVSAIAGLTAGITGSIKLFANSSPSIRDTMPSLGNIGSKFSDTYLETERAHAKIAAASGSTNILSQVSAYMTKVESMDINPRDSKELIINRFVPPFQYNSDFARKRIVKDMLFPFYRNVYKRMHWGFTNYSCLNFFTGSEVPSNKALIYPAAVLSSAGQTSEDTIFYAPDRAFTFQFWINPRYTVDNPGGVFKAGTILHMSSSYALSLVTGSSLGLNGKPDKFRMMLQLSSSAEILPSLISLTSSNNTRPKNDSYSGITRNQGDLVFLSSDNSLSLGSWHNVAIKWGGQIVNNGSGSFVIDGKQDSTFFIPSSSVMQQVFSGAAEPLDADALFVGNFYEGTNLGTHAIANFFNSSSADTEGLTVLSSLSADPVSYSLNHPLNAEIHDVRIYNRFLSDSEIASGSKDGATLTDDLLFYLPPLFVKETRSRDILQTPFQSFRGKTEDPFNIPLSFGVGGNYINAENFLREFVRGEYPRLLNLSSSEVTTSTDSLSADSHIYGQPGARARNLFLMPCDNGLHVPNFSLLSSGTNLGNSGSNTEKFVSSYGQFDLSTITLENMLNIDTSTNPTFIHADLNNTSSISYLALGSTPEDPSVSPGNILTIAQRTFDPSSNNVVFFDVSNMFYGDRIRPLTYTLTDAYVTGSGGKMKVTLKDDGYGVLYRADANTPHAKWNDVGNIIYDEGISVIKSPFLSKFGNEAFSTSFDGERNVHVMEISVPAPKGMINSSSNPTWKAMKPSDYDSETESEFVYITGINIHDENLNVIARANFAQPVMKRNSDRILTKLRLDF